MAASHCGVETCGADEPCVAYSHGNRVYGTVCAGASSGDSGTGRGRKPTKGTYLTLQFYFLGWVSDEELAGHLSGPKKS